MKKPTKQSWSMLRQYPIIVVALSVGLFLFVALCGLYLYKFGRQLPEKPETWGQFGDYIGGILNPIFAFMAFIGVVVSLQMQLRQQEEARKRARLDLLQDLIASHAQHIETALRQHWPDRHKVVGHPYGETAPLSQFLLKLAFAERSVISEHEHNYSEFSEQKMRDTFNSLIMQFHDLAGDQASFALLLKRWTDAGGEIDLVSRYSRQFLFSIMCIHLLGFTGSQDLFEEVFPAMKNLLKSRQESIRVVERPFETRFSVG
jgi:hypothetical protein